MFEIQVNQLTLKLSLKLSSPLFEPLWFSPPSQTGSKWKCLLFESADFLSVDYNRLFHLYDKRMSQEEKEWQTNELRFRNRLSLCVYSFPLYC